MIRYARPVRLAVLALVACACGRDVAAVLAIQVQGPAGASAEAIDVEVRLDRLTSAHVFRQPDGSPMDLGEARRVDVTFKDGQTGSAAVTVRARDVATSRTYAACVTAQVAPGRVVEVPVVLRSAAPDCGSGGDGGAGGVAGDADAGAAGSGGTARPPDAGAMPDGGAPGPCTPRHGANCDPVTNAGCEAGTKCDVGGNRENSAGLYAWCECHGAGRSGEPCAETATGDSCAPGHSCGMGTCMRFCRTAVDCAPGEVCIGLPPFLAFCGPPG